jgi:signal transduction histidine kinase
MFIKIALILSVILQFLAAIIAISLIRRTKYNVSWMLISSGFILLAIQRITELLDLLDYPMHSRKTIWESWLSFSIALLMLVGVIFIKRIFKWLQQIDNLRKQNESRVLSAILKTEESERLKFAKELHDGLGPILSSVKMAISALSRSITKENDKKIVENTAKLIEESLLSLKEISNKLSPHILNNFGLLKAIESFISKFGNSADFQIDLSSNLENKRFDYNVEVVLYRVVCELIANTIKHSGANHISIDIAENESMINLVYSDNGIGFDDQMLDNQNKGMGYSNIKSRIKSLNGSLNVETSPNEGVCVNVSIKIKVVTQVAN